MGRCRADEAREAKVSDPGLAVVVEKDNAEAHVLVQEGDLEAVVEPGEARGGADADVEPSGPVEGDAGQGAGRSGGSLL